MSPKETLAKTDESCFIHNMTDDNENQPLRQQAAPQALPDTFDIPRQLLDHWISTGPNEYLEIQITKRDVDKLFFSIVKGLNAQEETHSSIIAWSNGNTVAANEAMQRSRRLIIESQNEIRQFLAAVMAGSIKGS
jgi:hypothetical protein